MDGKWRYVAVYLREHFLITDAEAARAQRGLIDFVQSNG
jgi:hypothetical protein